MNLANSAIHHEYLDIQGITAKIALHEGFHGWPIPSLAIRGSGTRVLGTRDFNMSIAGLDFSPNKVIINGDAMAIRITMEIIRPKVPINTLYKYFFNMDKENFVKRIGLGAFHSLLFFNFLNALNEACKSTNANSLIFYLFSNVIALLVAVNFVSGFVILLTVRRGAAVPAARSCAAR